MSHSRHVPILLVRTLPSLSLTPYTHPYTPIHTSSLRLALHTHTHTHTQDPREMVDYHVHLVGHGDSGSGCYLHGAVSLLNQHWVHALPESTATETLLSPPPDQTKSWWNPYYRLKTAVFMSAAQVPDMEG